MGSIIFCKLSRSYTLKTLGHELYVCKITVQETGTNGSQSACV